MSDLNRVRGEVSALVEDIAQIQGQMGAALSDPGDREAFDIVARIERKLRAGVLHETALAR